MSCCIYWQEIKRKVESLTELLFASKSHDGMTLKVANCHKMKLKFTLWGIYNPHACEPHKLHWWQNWISLLFSHRWACKHTGGSLWKSKDFLFPRVKSCESLFIEVLLQIVEIGMYGMACFVFLRGNKNKIPHSKICLVCVNNLSQTFSWFYRRRSF